METHIRISGDDIFLYWDGRMPPGYSSNDHVDIKEMHYLWPPLTGRCSFYRSKGAFRLALSKQNLERLRKQFGDIRMRSGGEIAYALRDRYNEFLKTQGVALAVKEDKDSEGMGIEYKMPPLADYQRKGVVFLATVPKVALFADCGMGKTYMVLVSCQHHIKTGQVKRGKTLVFAKLATLETAWLEDVSKFTDLKAEVLRVPQGKKKKEKFLEKLNGDADIFIINHEGAKTFHDELCSHNFEKVVIDESTVLKSFTGVKSKIKGGTIGKCIFNIARSAKWRVIMSGTPAPNGAHELWGQINFLDADGFMLEASYSDFRSEYMKKVVLGKLKRDSEGIPIPGVPAHRNTPVKWEMRPEKVADIRNNISAISFRAKIRDHIKDLPHKTTIMRRVPLTREQEVAYERLQKELWVQLGGHGVSVENALSELAKLRQVTGGFLTDDKQEIMEFPKNPKVEMMDQLLEEEIDPSNKVVIFAQYRWEIDMLKNRYKNHGVVSVYGKNSAAQNERNLKAFMQDKDVRLIILHPRSAAHGVTLTMAHYMIFYSISYSAEEDYQAVARIERASQKHPMFVYYLLGKLKKGFCLDEIIYKVLQSKKIEQTEILDSDTVSANKLILSAWQKQLAR